MTPYKFFFSTTFIVWGLIFLYQIPFGLTLNLGTILVSIESLIKISILVYLVVMLKYDWDKYRKQLQKLTIPFIGIFLFLCITMLSGMKWTNYLNSVLVWD
jgi:hypothetical protein